MLNNLKASLREAFDARALLPQQKIGLLGEEERVQLERILFTYNRWVMCKAKGCSTERINLISKKFWRLIQND